MPEADGGLNGVVTAAMYPLEGEGRITKVSANVNRSRRFNASQDTFIDATRPALNFGGAQTMWVGFNDQMRPLVQVPFPVCDNVFTCIPSDAQVDVAYLYLYVFEGRGFTNWDQSVMGVSVHPVNSMWDEGTANWTTPWASPGGDVGPADSVTRLGSARINTWLRLDVPTRWPPWWKAMRPTTASRSPRTRPTGQRAQRPRLCAALALPLPPPSSSTPARPATCASSSAPTNKRWLRGPTVVT